MLAEAISGILSARKTLALAGTIWSALTTLIVPCPPEVQHQTWDCPSSSYTGTLPADGKVATLEGNGSKVMVATAEGKTGSQ